MIRKIEFNSISQNYSDEIVYEIKFFINFRKTPICLYLSTFQDRNKIIVQFLDFIKEFMSLSQE